MKLILSGVLIAALVLAAACDGRGPTTPTSSVSTVQTHIRGYVFDTLSQSVPGALIEVLDGPRAGATTTSDGRGAYELVGNATGNVRLRASRDGFEAATIATGWLPPASAQEVRFYLKRPTPALPLTPGSYTLTVTSDLPSATGSTRASCTGFPVELARRTYDASINIRSFPSGDTQFEVELASPTIINPQGSGGCRPSAALPIIRGCFSFRVAGQFMGFEIENGWGWDWIEEWPGFRYLTIGGHAPTSEPATSTESSTSVPFWGTFEYCELKAPLGSNSNCGQVPPELVVDYRSCTSKNDTMVFTKR